MNKFFFRRIFPTQHRYRLLIVVLYAFIQFVAIFFLPLTHEESLNVLLGRLAIAGAQPYHQIFTLASPLFTALIIKISATGMPLWVIKLCFAAFGGMLVFNISAIAALLFNEKTATMVALVTATTAALNVSASQVQPVIPALALATLSLLLVMSYRGESIQWWGIFAGGIWVLGLGLSDVVLTVPVPIILMLLFRRQAREMIWYWVLGGVLFGGVLLLAFFSSFEYLISVYLKIIQSVPPVLETNFYDLGQFAWFNAPLFLLAIVGAAALYVYFPDHAGWVAVIWLTVGVGWVAILSVIRLFDTISLLPSMALLAGFGCITVIRVVPVKIPLQWMGVISIVFVVILYALITLQLTKKMVYRTVDTQDDVTAIRLRPEVISFVDTIVSPTECIITDDAALAIEAQRLPPPELLNLSPERVQSELLSFDRLKSYATTANCPAVIFSKRELSLHLSDFEKWVIVSYPHVKKFGSIRVYFREE